jgi:hypothetical protein
MMRGKTRKGADSVAGKAVRARGLQSERAIAKKTRGLG